MMLDEDLFDEIMCAVCACDHAWLAEIEARHRDVPVQLAANLLNEGGGDIYTSEELLARIGSTPSF